MSLTAAIGIHFVVGYTNLWHLTPALLGAGSLVTGLALTFPTAYRTRGRAAGHPPAPPNRPGQAGDEAHELRA